MTDKEYFKNKCPYTNRICLNRWNCSQCETERAEREFMEEMEREKEEPTSETLPDE